MSRRDLDEWLWQVGAELQRISEEITPSGPKFARRSAWEPRVDVVEMPAYLMIKAEIAGVRGEDIRIAYNVDRGCLVIRGTRHEEHLPEGACGGFHQLEIYYGQFEREVKLPDMPLRPKELQAKYANGFLIVKVPKERASDEILIIQQEITLNNS